MKFVALFFIVMKTGYYRNPDYQFELVTFDSRAQCQAEMDSATYATQHSKSHSWIGAFTCIQADGPPPPRLPVLEKIAEGWDRS